MPTQEAALVTDSTKPSGGGQKRYIRKSGQLNVRLSEEGWASLLVLLKHYGLTQPSMLEVLLRDRIRDIGYRVSIKENGAIEVEEKDGRKWILSFDEGRRI